MRLRHTPRRVAPPANARYVARPKSKPHHGKAGNLNYTLRHVLYPQGPGALLRAPPGVSQRTMDSEENQQAHDHNVDARVLPLRQQ